MSLTKIREFIKLASGRPVLAVLACLFVVLTQLGHPVHAQTPASQPKSCNYAGGPHVQRRPLKPGRGNTM
jgi:hypothetical protein